MVKRFPLVCLFLLTFGVSKAQIATVKVQRPKLVVGLVIDQMRWDYLYRYNELYGNEGFKRILAQGFSCENTFIPYLPTYTAVGHTSIYSGSMPSITGIIGNDWYDKSLQRKVYCTDDSTVSTVGSETKAAGKMSPENMWVTTVSDELRLSNNFKSKVIGIALKDRGAILPAGHAANAAYWYDDKTGKWITSTYYMQQLPAWVNNFNDQKLPDAYMSKDWNTLLPLSQYSLSTADTMSYEGTIIGEKTTTFPHILPSIKNEKYEALKATPGGTTLTFDFAKAAIENEKMGMSNVTDFLTISVSSTDYIGHAFGPNSIEAEDTYLRLDQDIASFLAYLDGKVGKGNYLLFLSADHGVAHIPGFLKDHNIPAGTFNYGEIKKELTDYVSTTFNVKNAISTVINNEVYFDDTEIQKQGADAAKIEKGVIILLKKKSYIADAYLTSNLASANAPEPIKTMMINGYNATRSGDIQFIGRPGFFESWNKTGTTHGAWNPYDSHIPLLWFGWNIKQGKTNRETYMTDIAATVAAMLKIQMPSGCVGKVIEEVSK